MPEGYHVYHAQLPAGRNCFGGNDKRNTNAGTTYILALNINLDGAGDLSTCCGVATCTPFSITFPATPTGYTVTDSTATTVQGLGLSCDASARYSGTPALTCDGMTFSAPSGCVPQGQCGPDPACPDGYEKRATNSTENYCAGATCDLTDEAGTCKDAAFANDLVTCCEAATCTP